GECGASRAAGRGVARRGPALREARRDQRRAEAEALHACGHGPRHADSKAHQPRRDRGCREGTLMGQKTHPIGFRLGITKPWRSQWYAGRDMPALLKEDALLRKYLKARLGHAA